MNTKTMKRISKLMSLALRHRPQVLGLELDEGGWCEVTQLVAALKRREAGFDRSRLELVVAENDKKRFAFSEDGQRIRANQGHSITVDLGYQQLEPPEELYHGTATHFLASIRKKGLIKGQRHHVHLSADVQTAQQVGVRLGKLSLLRVRSGAMHRSGHPFFRSDNGVWLCEAVPPEYLHFPV